MTSFTQGFLTTGDRSIRFDQSREVIAAASAQQKYEAKFYSQGASPSGVVQVAGLGKAAKDKFREEWEKVRRGTTLRSPFSTVSNTSLSR